MRYYSVVHRAMIYSCSHLAILLMLCSISSGASMRIASLKVNTHAKNGGLGATLMIVRKCALSIGSVCTVSPNRSMIVILHIYLRLSLH